MSDKSISTVRDNDKFINRVLLESIVVSLVSIVLCVVVLCSATWAWFTDSAASATSTITAGTFSLDIVVARITDSASAAAISEGTTAPASSDVITPGEDGKYRLTNGSYSVTLTPKTGSCGGYCKIKVNDSEEYYFGEIPSERTFRLVLSADATITFESRWGKCSISNVNDDGVLTIPTTTSASTTGAETTSAATDVTTNE